MLKLTHTSAIAHPKLKHCGDRWFKSLHSTFESEQTAVIDEDYIQQCIIMTALVYEYKKIMKQFSMAIVCAGTKILN